MRKTSKKHHYLPRYYLNGFTNSKGTFFVYDKEKDNIFLTNPGDAFFENQLNTVTLPNGDSSDFLEELYTDLENKCWSSFDTIRESTRKTPINLLDEMHLFLFLLFLFWRLPSNTDFAAKLSDQAFLDNEAFDYFRLMDQSGNKAPKEIAERLKNSSSFKKAFRQVVPWVPFFKDKDWAHKLENWRFVYTEDERNFDMVGDNPIITRDSNVHDVVNCLREFVFPVSGKILLVNTDKPLSKGLPPTFLFQFNIAIIKQAQRFAACSDKDFLEALIKYYKTYVQFGKTNEIIPDMFNMLE